MAAQPARHYPLEGNNKNNDKPLRSILRGSPKAPSANGIAPLPDLGIDAGNRRRDDSSPGKDWLDLSQPGHQAAAASFFMCVLISLAVLVLGASFYFSGAAGGGGDAPPTEPVTVPAPNATEATERALPQRGLLTIRQYGVVEMCVFFLSVEYLVGNPAAAAVCRLQKRPCTVDLSQRSGKQTATLSAYPPSSTATVKKSKQAPKSSDEDEARKVATMSELGHNNESKLPPQLPHQQHSNDSGYCSAEQWAVMLDFLCVHTGLGRDTNELRPETRQRLWSEMTSLLNALGPASRSREEWRRYWQNRVTAARKRASELAATEFRNCDIVFWKNSDGELMTNESLLNLNLPNGVIKVMRFRNSTARSNCLNPELASSFKI
ncbi:hypothetical protein V5799_023535 [Amblyomma americanum]|uniref:Regulatory protein zeste n=1 Tax=Amblyomma americanum TaxID=6943 RepID=A0AAQ4FHN2_AMBAM